MKKTRFMKYITISQAEDIQRLREENRTRAEVASVMGKKHWVITEFVQFFDMSTPYQIEQQAKTDKAKKQITEKQSEILEMAADNWTVKDMAAETGIDRRRLYLWLKKNNVKFKKNKYNGRKVKPVKVKAEPIRKPAMKSAAAMALGVKI